MQCPCKCQMLDCIVCWQHDGKSKCSSVFLCTVKSPQLNSLIYRHELHSAGSDAAVAHIAAARASHTAGTSSTTTCHAHCRRFRPHKILRFVIMRHADQGAEESDLQRAETSLYSPNPSMMEYINESCHTRWKRMYYAYTNCTFNAADLQITVLGGGPQWPAHHRTPHPSSSPHCSLYVR